MRDSLRHRRDIENAYLEQIDAARSEVILANAYFFPTRRFRRALMRAARRKVVVTLLLQGKSEHPLLYYASRALYRSLLDAGVRIHEYHRSELHAKVAVFDGRVATVGSSNIDPFSLRPRARGQRVRRRQGIRRGAAAEPARRDREAKRARCRRTTGSGFASA